MSKLSGLLNIKQVHAVGSKPLQERTLTRWWTTATDAFDALTSNPKVLVMSLVGLGAGGYGVYTFGDGVGQPEIPTTAEITGVRHRPAHYTTEYYTDSEGRRQSRQVYHPDEYHAKIVIPQSDSEKIVTLNSREYRELYPMVNHPTITYKAVYREGRWSHKATWIDLDNPLRQAKTEERQASLALPGPGQAKNSTGSW